MKKDQQTYAIALATMGLAPVEPMITTRPNDRQYVATAGLVPVGP